MINGIVSIAVGPARRHAAQEFGSEVRQESQRVPSYRRNTPTRTEHREFSFGAKGHKAVGEELV